MERENKQQALKYLVKALYHFAVGSLSPEEMDQFEKIVKTLESRYTGSCSVSTVIDGKGFSTQCGPVMMKTISPVNAEATLESEGLRFLKKMKTTYFPHFVKLPDWIKIEINEVIEGEEAFVSLKGNIENELGRLSSFLLTNFPDHIRQGSAVDVTLNLLQGLTGSEALFAFIAFIANNTEGVSFASGHNPGNMVNIIRTFAEANDLPRIRNNYLEFVKPVK